MPTPKPTPTDEEMYHAAEWFTAHPECHVMRLSRCPPASILCPTYAASIELEEPIQVTTLDITRRDVEMWAISRRRLLGSASPTLLGTRPTALMLDDVEGEPYDREGFKRDMYMLMYGGDYSGHSKTHSAFVGFSRAPPHRIPLEDPRTDIQRKADQCEEDAKLRALRTERLAAEADLITMKGV